MCLLDGKCACGLMCGRADVEPLKHEIKELSRKCIFMLPQVRQVQNDLK